MASNNPAILNRSGSVDMVPKHRRSPSKTIHEEEKKKQAAPKFDINKV